MTIALVTNVLAPYRMPLYALLAERYGVEVLCFGAGATYVPAWFGDLDRQLAAAPFPARRIARPARGAGARQALRRRDRAGRGRRDAAGDLPRDAPSRQAVRAVGVGVGAPRAAARRPRSALPLVRHVYRHADAVVTYGEHVRRYVARYRGHDDDVVIAPQSVEAEVFGRAVVRRRDRRLARRGRPARTARSSSTSAGWSQEKGIEELLQAWHLLAAESRPPSMPLPSRSRRRSQRSATARSPSRSPRPPAPACSAPSLASASPSPTPPPTLLVLPSIPTPRFREPWGLVCNEALHQGTPVVATTAVGAVAGGLVRDGETGLVVAPGDPQALATALERLLADPALRTRLGTAGRGALAGHTYAAMADAFGVALARAGALR